MRPPRSALLAVGLAACQDQGVTRFNSEPTAFIMSHQDGSPVVAGVEVELRGSVSDANHDAGALSVAWTVAGRPLCDPGPPAADGTTLCIAAIQADEVLLQLTVRDPEDATGTATATIDVLVGTPPTAEITAPSTDARLYSDVPVQLAGHVADAEDPATALTVTWEADGVSLGAASAASDGGVTGVATFDAGTHELALNATDTRGETARDTRAITVGGPNAAPTCSIDEPGDSASVPQGEPVLFRGTALDADIAAERLTASWASNRDGVLDAGSPGADGSLVFSTSTDLSAGAHTITLTVTDEVGAACSDQRVLTVSERPTLVVNAPLSGAVVTSEDAVRFSATVSDAEDDPQTLAVTWTSDRDGLFQTSTPDSSGEVAFSTDALSPAVHAITAQVTDSDGLRTSRLFNLEVTDCGLISWYDDADGDGYGDDGVRYDGCAPPSGYVAQGGDCDDGDAAINPGAAERCSTAGIDDDCDGAADESDAADATTWYTDSDGDGYGETTTATPACVQPSGAVVLAGDCDDSTTDVHPGQDEVCGNAVDEDCDGAAITCQVEVPLADADARFYGDDTGDQAGASVAGAGDVNGDGYDDLIIGAPWDDGAASDAGAAYLWSGPVTGDHSLADAAATLQGTQADDRAGRAVAGVGDLDSDGMDDLLVGAATECSSSSTGASVTGAAYLVHGPVSGTLGLGLADATLSGAANGDKAGFAVAAAGDVDGDGNPDLLIGSCGEDAGGSNAGAAYLLLGPITGSQSLSAAAATFQGERTSDLAASALAGGGDVNGDGYDDLLIGAYAEDSGGNASGSAYLVFGPYSGTLDLAYADAQLVGEAAQDFAGRAVAMVGDSDADGFDDLLIGASGNDGNGTGAGAAYLVRGATSSLSGAIDLSLADATLQGESTLAYAGRAVSGAGDLDADGFDDLLVGAHGDDGGGTAAGAAYLIYAPISGTLVLDEPEVKLVGEAAGDEAGFSVAAAGDVDGDGTPDVIVGAWAEATAGTDAGAAYLILGSSLP